MMKRSLVRWRCLIVLLRGLLERAVGLERTVAQLEFWREVDLAPQLPCKQRG